jgi:iron complex transport system ATP-binding protein
MNLEVNNLSFDYASISVLKNVTFKVELGEVVSIVGPNGSGKSTLLKCINRILKPKQHAVLVDGNCCSKIDLREMSKLMSYVPQSSNSTFPLTVFDVVLLGRRPYVNWSLTKKDYKIAAEMLEFLGIGSMAMRAFNELSGGEQQKVVIARALAQQPQFLLFDEPTSSLDIKHQLDILSTLRSLSQNFSRGVLVSIHDLNLASRFSDKMIMLKKGAIFAAGSPDEVLTESNIQAVYDVKVVVTRSILGLPQITPLSSEPKVLKLKNMPPIAVPVKKSAS